MMKLVSLYKTYRFYERKQKAKSHVRRMEE